MSADINTAQADLKKVWRKFTRMSTRKVFRKPVDRIQEYAPPQSGMLGVRIKDMPILCNLCFRPIGHYGKHCRECFQKLVREKYERRVREEDERVSLFEKAFNNLLSQGVVMTDQAIVRSTAGLRDVLFQEMENLRSGTSSAQRARSIAMMANSILQSVQVEIEYHKYVNSNRAAISGEKKIVELGTNILLGTEAA